MKKTIIILPLLAAVLFSSCKKEEGVSLDVYIDADSLALNSLDFNIKEVWMNYSLGKEFSKWKKIENTEKNFNWTQFSHTSDSLFYKGLQLEKMDVLQQFRFVVETNKSKAIQLTDTLYLALDSTVNDVQSIVNSKIIMGERYAVHLKWEMSSMNRIDSTLFIQPKIKTTSFKKK